MPPMSITNKRSEVGSLGVQSTTRPSSPSKTSVSMGSLGVKSANAGSKRPFMMMTPAPATTMFRKSYSTASSPYSSTPSLQSQLQFQMELQRALAVMQMQARQPLFSPFNGSPAQLSPNMFQSTPPASQALASLLQQRNMNTNVNTLNPPQPPTTGRFVDVSVLKRDTKRRKVVKSTVHKTKKPSAEEGASSKNSKKARQTMGRWTEEEHARFLEGLDTYGSHDWRGVAGVVKTRTIIQVRTHAQKYFQKIGKAAASESCAGSSAGLISESNDSSSVAGSIESSGTSTPREAIVHPHVGTSPCMSPSLIAVDSAKFKRLMTSSFTFNNNVQTKVPETTSALARLASIALSELSGV